MGSAAVIPILKSNSLNILYTDLHSNCSQTFFFFFLMLLFERTGSSCILVLLSSEWDIQFEQRGKFGSFYTAEHINPSLPLSGYELRLLLYGHCCCHFIEKREPSPANRSPSPGHWRGGIYTFSGGGQKDGYVFWQRFSQSIMWSTLYPVWDISVFLFIVQSLWVCKSAFCQSLCTYDFGWELGYSNEKQ